MAATLAPKGRSSVWALADVKTEVDSDSLLPGARQLVSDFADSLVVV